jgi:hypothetical protein
VQIHIIAFKIIVNKIVNNVAWRTKIKIKNCTQKRRKKKCPLSFRGEVGSSTLKLRVKAIKE